MNMPLHNPAFDIVTIAAPIPVERPRFDLREYPRDAFVREEIGSDGAPE